MAKALGYLMLNNEFQIIVFSNVELIKIKRALLLCRLELPHLLLESQTYHISQTLILWYICSTYEIKFMLDEAALLIRCSNYVSLAT